jgi:hypothetical protein
VKSARLLLLLALPAFALAADPAPKVAARAPIKNFRLPTFTVEGFRHTMLRAAEARVPSPDRIDVIEMELTLFTGLKDEQIESMLAAPSASFFPEKLLASGASTVRLERGDLTLTGADWTYDHPAATVTIRRDAHLTFRSPIGDILK